MTNDWRQQVRRVLGEDDAADVDDAGSSASLLATIEAIEERLGRIEVAFTAIGDLLAAVVDEVRDPRAAASPEQGGRGVMRVSPADAESGVDDHLARLRRAIDRLSVSAPGGDSGPGAMEQHPQG